MKEILLTSSLTVISGIIVFIIGQVLHTIWLNPLQKYKEIKHDVAVYLSYYARVYSNVIDISTASDDDKLKVIEVSDKIRMLSCELAGYIETLSWMKIGIPSKEKLSEATNLLMLLSNSLITPYDCPDQAFEGSVSNHNTADEIRFLMGMYGYKNKKS